MRENEMKMNSNLRTQGVMNILMMKADLEPELTSDEEESESEEDSDDEETVEEAGG